MENTARKHLDVVKSAVVVIAWVVATALCYFTITMLTPTFSFTFGGQMGLRLANGLRALALFNPGAAIGVAMGSQWTTIASGRIGVGLFPIVSFCHLALGLTTYKLANSGTRSHIKNIALLTGFGIGMGIVIACVQYFSGGAIIMKGAHISFGMILYTKIFSETLATLTGYPLYMAFKALKK